MGNSEELITLVVHTEEHALKLKEILEFHDIHVVIEDVISDSLPLGMNARKVRIPVDSLALGLKILESGETTAASGSLIKMTGMGSSVLIPVDFSTHSILAVRIGFFIAEKFDVEPIILHSFIAPLFITPETTFADPLMTGEDMSAQETEAIEDTDLRKLASAQLSKFKKQIETMQRNGEIPNIRFSTTLLEGIPEQVIQEYCKENHPLMVVMATRGANRKSSDLVGSVTAEVIDSCRVPVFTVPDTCDIKGVDTIKRVAMFCTFQDFDVITMRWLMRAFDFPSCDIYLIPSGDSPVSKIPTKLDSLRQYMIRTYPTANFHAIDISEGKFDDKVGEALSRHDIQLIIVPNKKSSAFSRFFRPTLAHRILFEKDIPLLVLPI